MPRGDRTGPNGQGAMTGRAVGFCAGFNAPGFMSPGFVRGRGGGFGRGFGWRGVVPARAVQPEMDAKQEKVFLESELKALKEETLEIEKRLKELK